MISTFNSTMLDNLCKEENWFTKGTAEQYKRVLDMVDEGYTARDISPMIAICSEPTVDIDTVEDKIVKRVRKNLLDANGDVYLTGLLSTEVFRFNKFFCEGINVSAWTLHLTGRIIITINEEEISMCDDKGTCILRFKTKEPKSGKRIYYSDVTKSRVIKKVVADEILGSIKRIKEEFYMELKSVEFSAKRYSSRGVQFTPDVRVKGSTVVLI